MGDIKEAIREGGPRSRRSLGEVEQLSVIEPCREEKSHDKTTQGTDPDAEGSYSRHDRLEEHLGIHDFPPIQSPPHCTALG